MPDGAGYSTAISTESVFLLDDPDPADPRKVRRWAAEWCEQQGLVEFVPDLSVVVSELVSNAIRHGQPPITVRLFDGAPVRIEVHDCSPAGPRPRSPDRTEVTGRGLGIVGALGRWGWEPSAGGKTVWAVLATPAG